MKLQEEHDAKAAMYAEQQKQVTINHISGGFFRMSQNLRKQQNR